MLNNVIKALVRDNAKSKELLNISLALNAYTAFPHSEIPGSATDNAF